MLTRLRSQEKMCRGRAFTLNSWCGCLPRLSGPPNTPAAEVFLKKAEDLKTMSAFVMARRDSSLGPFDPVTEEMILANGGSAEVYQRQQKKHSKDSNGGDGHYVVGGYGESTGDGGQDANGDHMKEMPDVLPFTVDELCTAGGCGYVADITIISQLFPCSFCLFVCRTEVVPVVEGERALVEEVAEVVVVAVAVAAVAVVDAAVDAGVEVTGVKPGSIFMWRRNCLTEKPDTEC